MRQNRPRPSATRESRSSPFVRKRLAPASGLARFVRPHAAARARRNRPRTSGPSARARAFVRALRLPGQDGSRCEPPAHPHAARDMSERRNREAEMSPVAKVRPVHASPGVCPNAAIAGARWSVAAARLVRAGQGHCPNATTIGGKMSPVAITRPLRTGPGHSSEHRDREAAQALGIRPNAANTRATSFAKHGEAVRPDRPPSPRRRPRLGDSPGPSDRRSVRRPLRPPRPHPRCPALHHLVDPDEHGGARRPQAVQRAHVHPAVQPSVRTLGRGDLQVEKA